jgi:CubicO group peptidase (beta-lactamase class C family)
MAVLQLQQQGKLDVQDPICQYIQDCPEAWQPITIHHLLTHSSGIRNFTVSSSYAEFKKQSTTPINTVEQFRNLPLDFVPGERWRYSNSGYIVLGYIIEKVSGQPYAVFLQDDIFEPLQMTDTGYDDNHRVIMHRASGYSNTAANADYIDMSVPYAAGGLYSTVEDLFLWDQALYTGELIPISLQSQMFMPFVPIPVDARARIGSSPDAQTSYGYGWRIDKQFGQLWISHGGGIEGFATEFDRYPDDKVAIIVLSNLESARVGDIASEIARMIFGAN